jgi:hypothetical protein
MQNDKRVADTSEEWELFLLGLRYRDSKLITRSGNEPFLLSGSDQAWLVYQGTVDIFAVQLVDGQPSGARYHLFRAYTNQLLLGIDLADQPIGWLASCAPQTQVLRFSRDRLRQQMNKPEHVPIIHGMLEAWIEALSSGITAPVKPKTYVPLEAGQEIAVEADQIVRTKRDVVWVRPSSAAISRFPCQNTTGCAPPNQARYRCSRRQTSSGRTPTGQGWTAFIHWCWT